MPSLPRTITRSIEQPSATDLAQLDQMASCYGKTAKRFLKAFESKELRRETLDFKPLRNRLVGVLALKEQEFEKEVVLLKAEGKSEEAALLEHLRSIRESKQPHLQARHWKLALEEASLMSKTHWLTVCASARVKLSTFAAKLNETDRHYVNWLVCGPYRQFFDLLDGRSPDPTSPEYSESANKKKKVSFEIRPVRMKALANLVRRKINRIRRVEVSPPRPSVFKNRIDFDCSCYSVEEKEGKQILSLMSLHKGKRISLTLRGKSKVRGTVQMIREKTGVYSLRVYVPQECEETRTEGEKVGIDLGYTEVLTTDQGERYGEQLGTALSAISDRQNEKMKGRNRMFARKREHAKKSDKFHSDKAQKIAKHNLGRKKLNKQARKDKEQIKSIVNHALNAHMKNKKRVVSHLVMEDLTHRMRSEFGRKWNRRLSHWVRGYIRERIEYKAKKYGVTITLVNAAFTSRQCPICSCTAKENRHGNLFKCLCCGYQEASDRVGAINIFTRADDREICLNMQPQKVKAVLEERHRRFRRNQHTVTGRTSAESLQCCQEEAPTSLGIHAKSEQSEKQIKADVQL